MSALAGVGRLLIDGNNLLHRTSGGIDAGAQRLLLAKLSGSIPPTVNTVLMLDGHHASGTDRRQRVRRGLEIHHSGSISADDALLNIIRDTAPAERGQLTLVSDDRALYEKARRLGAQTKRLAWLEAMLDEPSAPGRPVGAGAGRPPRQAPPDKEREPWKPGRGATAKRGNPRRGRRA